MSQELRIKVLCVEDDAIIALDLQRQINKQADMSCIGWLSNADTLTGTIAEKSPDIILLDLSMPGRDPIEALEESRSAHPGLKALVCSGHTDPSLLDRAQRAGATGFYLKGNPIEELLDSIRRIVRG